MHFDKFAFGSIQIDGSTYEHDVVIDGEFANARRNPPSNSASSSATRHYLLRRRYRGNVSASWSEPARTADFQ